MHKLGYEVSYFYFIVPGVVSISADVHKYGFSPKGVSVVMYRDAAPKKYQGFMWGDDHSVYSTPTFATSQPSSLLAAGWVVMNYTDELGSTMAGRRALDRSSYQVARASIGQISTSVSPRMQ